MSQAVYMNKLKSNEIQMHTYEGKHQQLNDDENHSTESGSHNNKPHEQLQYFLSAKVCHWKGPLLYVLCQLLVVCSLVYAQFDFLDGQLTGTLKYLFLPVTLATYIMYLRAVFTNPGYLIGDQQDEKRRAGAFDPRDYQINENNAMGTVNANNLNTDNNFNYNSTGSDQQTTNNADGKQHSRKRSYLTKGLQISRHERTKTQQSSSSGGAKNTFNDQNANYENLETVSDNQPSFMQQTVQAANALQLMSTNNDALNESKHTVASRSNNVHNRIPSYVPKNAAAQSTASGKDKEVDLNLSVQEEKRQEAYKMIQSKIASSTSNYQEIESVQPTDFMSNIGGELSPFNAVNKKFDLDVKNSEETTKAQTNMDTNTVNSMPDFGAQKILYSREIKEKSNNADFLTYDTQGIEEDHNMETIQQQHNKMQTENVEFDNTVASRQSSVADMNYTTQGQNYKKSSDQMDTIEEEVDAVDGQGNNGDTDEVLLFIEYKYCTVCHVEQPLRSKHCKKCDHCVATFDHHCPWIGNCVGERNRSIFFWYLVVQQLQLLAAVPVLLQITATDKIDQVPLGLTCVVLLDLLAIAGFSFFVLALLVFHSFLASRNLSSWEYLSWMKITYMKVWPRKYGSPFNEGVSRNLQLFFCSQRTKHRYIYQWKMPKKLPSLLP